MRRKLYTTPWPYFLLLALLCAAGALPLAGQMKITDAQLRPVLRKHKELVSIPNLPADTATMLQNLDWVSTAYESLGFTMSRLPSSTLPILLAEKTHDPSLKTVLFYFHIDGQPVNPSAWDQADPFTPVLKQRGADGVWEQLDYDQIDRAVDDEWRVFARAAADDKAPILILHAAMELLAEAGKTPAFNVKILFDPEEEYGSKALLSTLEQHRSRYEADYFLVLDGPAHETNGPTLTFGCRGIATCELTTYGASQPQHSGHMGNYVPNPVFALSRLLASMKDEQGRVLVKDYYADVKLDAENSRLLGSVPFDSAALNERLVIHQAERVGKNYQEALQYPTLNVRQLGTSWTGEGLKTVIPDYARAFLDLRLVPETEGSVQVERLRAHVKREGFTLLNDRPSPEERRAHPHIASLSCSRILNAFRTDPNDAFGKRLRTGLAEALGEEPVTVRMMGGTVPIVPVIEALRLPTVILPMVNIDNNQHAPNENIRIGNIRQGIAMCHALLQLEL